MRDLVDAAEENISDASGYIFFNLAFFLYSGKKQLELYSGQVIFEAGSFSPRTLL